MSLTLDENQAEYQIRSYQPGVFKINELILTSSIIITPRILIEDWSPQTFTDLTKENLNQILALAPTILLLGTGSQLKFPPAALYGDLINAGIGVEIMDTFAACRTYNVLSSENRNVAAALIIN